VSAAKLYTPELLALAVELAQHPLDPALQVVGEARSSTCGSTLALGLALDPAGRIEHLGLRVRACAVGQASAAIFARHARGRDAADLDRALADLRRWLAGEGELPAWPDLALIAPAQAYPGRHGAILLPWVAAAIALSTGPAPR
jgi:NifU-like protein involved in Fe-S cluster formation